MLEFCPVNQSLSNPWENGGIHFCFSGLISICLFSAFALPFLFQLFCRRKFAVPPDRERRLQSRLWFIHVLFCIASPFLCNVLILLPALTNGRTVSLSGFHITHLIICFTLWGLSISLMYFEHRYVFHGSRIRKHSLVLRLFWSFMVMNALLPLLSLKNSDWWWKLKTASDISAFCLWISNVLICIALAALGFYGPGLPLVDSAEYARLEADQISEGRWTRLFRRLKLVYPFIWPRDDRIVQARVFLCICILVLERVTNLYSPILYKRIVDSLTVSTNQTSYDSYRSTTPHSWFHQMVARLVGENGLIYRWDYVLAFIGVRFLQGLGGFGGGLLGAARSQLWIGVDQYSTRELSIMLFAHLHGLSLQWHLSRKTGEMLRIMDRGTASISSVLSYVVFNILPTVVDIFVGVAYFVVIFNAWYGVLVFATMAIYMVTTVFITEKRAKYRREMNTSDNEKSTKAVDALLNFETVKYFNAERFEVDRFKNAFINYQRAEWRTTASLNLLNTVQCFTIVVGLLIGTLLCSRDVVEGRLTVGDFVLFYTYMLQLYSPLGFFGTYYRLLQTSVIDMENMFDLLEQNPSVSDVPGASDLRVCGGEIEFRNVCFHYLEDRQILRNVSFKVPAGQTVALVGQSGSGKSTIVRLLFRFYDVTEGEILIDGQNISHVTQNSLRKAIGVVPQDTVLFNDTILYNIRYGRQNANEFEVEQAAVSADVHDRIQEFPQGYGTMVGERGLKLSGGEKQRVAIARNILKDPKILILDEATSALDTNTERNIQASLNKISQCRTTLVVAHRLSTIVHANQILMMHQGEIVERGTHDQLLSLPNGRYAALWRAQIDAHRPNESQSDQAR